MKIGQPAPDAAAIRTAETHQFAVDEATLLSEATQTLQDLGFNVTESSSEFGVVTGRKSRDATEAGQVAGAVLLTVATALLGAPTNVGWDKEQEIRVTIVTLNGGSPAAATARVSFERVVTKSNGLRWHERLTDQAMMQEFFTKLNAGLASAPGART
ncbi:hypothetical protein [Roseomonas elaeocarpi]|uniref:Uncharacterized protein n=1 Tax=Roseomonas elaeocarpi TaxID=907779 RepID=A0ABV6JSI1_9PROT